MTTRPEWLSSVKTATRCTIKLIGTLEDTAAVTDISRSVLGRCASATDPDIISLTGAMRLMQETGAPDILVAMASALGLTVTASDGAKPPTCLATAFGTIAEEFGDVAKRVGEALTDGDISPNERRAIVEAMFDLNRAVTSAVGAGAVTIVPSQGRAA